METFQTTDGTSHRSEILSPSEWSYFRFIEEAVDSVNRKCYKLNHLARLKAVVLMTAGQESRVRFDNRG
ncbi:MAG: hypothetical protein HYX84_05265 [Chloroflexi bacterium]|nr:hypothetical protein [Chloroflexota bacterium]